MHFLLIEGMNTRPPGNKEASDNGADDGGDNERPTGAIDNKASRKNVVHCVKENEPKRRKWGVELSKKENQILIQLLWSSWYNFVQGISKKGFIVPIFEDLAGDEGGGGKETNSQVSEVVRVAEGGDKTGRATKRQHLQSNCTPEWCEDGRTRQESHAPTTQPGETLGKSCPKAGKR